MAEPGVSGKHLAAEKNRDLGVRIPLLPPITDEPKGMTCEFCPPQSYGWIAMPDCFCFGHIPDPAFHSKEGCHTVCQCEEPRWKKEAPARIVGHDVWICEKCQRGPAGGHTPPREQIKDREPPPFPNVKFTS